MSYVPLSAAPTTPERVRQFIADVVDLHMRDVHVMMCLPLPAQGLDAGCNFACAMVLLALVGGASVMFFEPSRKRQERGRLFKSTLEEFYPWDTEPTDGLTDRKQGATLLYGAFRNPGTHSFAHERWRKEPRRISRLWKHGLDEAQLRQSKNQKRGRPKP